MALEPKVVAGAWLKRLDAAEPAGEAKDARALSLADHAKSLEGGGCAGISLADLAAALALLKAKSLVKTEPKLLLEGEQKDPGSVLRICLTPIGREAAKRLK